jgi:XTP/dITP diphosphohydrolase
MSFTPDTAARKPLSILIATGNAHKVKEFREMLAFDRLQWDDLTKHPGYTEVEETGATFAENAALKASGYARQFSSWALADDSGLEVDAINGGPGVYSARWAQRHNSGTGDAANNATLLRQIEKVPDEKRTGRFVCALALSDPTGRIVLSVNGTVEGRIIRESRGNNGFGYDPLFLIPDLGLTTAELSSQKKHELSHRGQALRKLKALMSQNGLA